MIDESTVNAVWEKATTVDNFDPTQFRKDACGAWIIRNHYGLQAAYGWEVDHVYPQSLEPCIGKITSLKEQTILVIRLLFNRKEIRM